MNFTSLLAFAAAALCGALALLGVIRRKWTVADWAFVVGMTLLALERVCGGFTMNAATAEAVPRWSHWRLLVTALVPGTWLIFSLSYARGDGHLFLARWRPIWLGALILPIGITISTSGSLLASAPPAPHATPTIALGFSGIALYSTLLTVCVLVLLNLERTFRASVGTMRWRIKFMLLGVGLIFVVRIYTNSQTLLFRQIDPRLETVNAAAAVLGVMVMLRSLVRAGQFEMAVYPSHSVLQGSLTVLLTGFYLLVVGVLAKVAAHLGGDAAFALKALLLLIALVLLAMLWQSDRIRLYLRRFVSRHFQRPMYDYRMAWRKFTEGTASRVEQTDLCRSLVRLIADMFAALSVTIWLLDERSETLATAASTSLSDAKARELAPEAADARDIKAHFQQHPEPVDVEALTDRWAVAVRSCSPSEFAHGGHRVCVPLIGRGELLGFIVVGDRVSGVPFSVQDFDMLKCVGDHAAANLLNVQLSQKLLAGREMEAFQTMAAFFVHDLKNAASTLNLMLQNLPVHFDNPEFRADALRGITKTANHINRLTGRLGALRHELKIQPTERDLNEIVSASLTDLKTATPDTIQKELQPVAKTLLDQEQLHKVITNLLLNALEAIPANGRVRVATEQTNGSVVLTVSDNGCGMTDEFVQRSLFRPFQTTKQHGLGIGMFQSRMIIEAHGGRVHVTSRPGQGSTFQVFLPIRTASR